MADASDLLSSKPGANVFADEAISGANVRCICGLRDRIYHLKKKTINGGSSYVFELNKCWDGVNEVDCHKLVGPDATKAAKAMTMTATSWLKQLVDKDTLILNHFEDYEVLFCEMDNCDTLVPGFEKRGLKCKDLITSDMRRAFNEMKNHKQRMKS